MPQPMSTRRMIWPSWVALLEVRGGGNVGGEGEERRGGDLGALRSERRPPADRERDQRHQGERQHVGADQEAQGRLDRPPATTAAT